MNGVPRRSLVWALIPFGFAIFGVAGGPKAVHANAYPRLGFYGGLKRIGYPLADSNGVIQPGVFDLVARFHQVVLDLDPCTPYRPDFLSQLRLRRPDIQLLAYVTGHYIWFSNDADSLNHYPTRYYNMIRNMNGFLYNKKGAQYGLTNSAFANVNLAKRDAKGRAVVADSVAALFATECFKVGHWDGVFVDTFCEGISWSQTPAESIDFARAGYSSQATFDVAWKAGTDSLAARLRLLAGGAAVLVGNCEPSTKYTWFNGWMRENFPNQGGGNWVANMYDNPGGYLVEELRFVPPRNNYISTSTNVALNPYDPENVRRVRLGLASAALGDGFSCLVPGARTPNYPYYNWWYDEFAVDLSTGNSSQKKSDTGWLGQPLGPYYQMIWVGTATEGDINPDVETDLTGWYFSNSVPATLTWDNTTAGHGNASMHVHINAPGPNTWAVTVSNYGGLFVSAGSQYCATFWAKASVPESLLVVQYATFPNSFGSRTIGIGTTWKQYQVSFTPGASGTSTLKFFMGYNTGDIWLDDIHYQPGATTLYRRDFTHGAVFVNPSPVPLSAPLPHAYRRINGIIDPPTNSGATVYTANVNPNDGLFLIDATAYLDADSGLIPNRVTLANPAPNPRPGVGPAAIAFGLPHDDRVRFDLYGPDGRRWAKREPEAFTAGRHTVSWAMGPLPPGLYFLRLTTASGERAVAKWVVLR